MSCQGVCGLPKFGKNVAGLPFGKLIAGAQAKKGISGGARQSRVMTGSAGKERILAGVPGKMGL